MLFTVAQAPPTRAPKCPAAHRDTAALAPSIAVAEQHVTTHRLDAHVAGAFRAGALQPAPRRIFAVRRLDVEAVADVAAEAVGRQASLVPPGKPRCRLVASKQRSGREPLAGMQALLKQTSIKNQEGRRDRCSPPRIACAASGSPPLKRWLVWPRFCANTGALPPGCGRLECFGLRPDGGSRCARQ
jgi:hypothetical protein